MTKLSMKPRAEPHSAYNRIRSKSSVGEASFSQVMSATRLHLPPDANGIPEATVQHLRNYIESAKTLGVKVAIAVNSHEAEITRVVSEAAPDVDFAILPVPYWGAFVPALNCLLSYAQQKGMNYILYQSLEVQCTAPVLKRLLQHHATPGTLVVGPTLDGHRFTSGRQGLNGRTTPWNTLALWRIRTLALTGFPCVADGRPSIPNNHVAEQNADALPNLLQNRGVAEIMGSEDWWDGAESPIAVHTREQKSVPAGVEEVTAIALLQHLHGKENARAVLLDFPDELRAALSWSASWGTDERRAAWHRQKMASKVMRPAAQLKELFHGHRRDSHDHGEVPFRRCHSRSKLEDEHGESNPHHAQRFGCVMHYSSSIPAPSEIKWICLASCGLFTMNATVVLASAFRQFNDLEQPTSLAVAGIGFLIGGVYLPTPVSLRLMRTVTSRWNHKAGLILFGVFMLIGHAIGLISCRLGLGLYGLQTARLIQGLGSGIGFQARFLLGTISTADHHKELQYLVNLTGDFGLGVGALLPALLSLCVRSNSFGGFDVEQIPSMAIMMLTSLYLVLVYVAFPCRVPILSPEVRFQDVTHRESDEPSQRGTERDKYSIWAAATLRALVQSAVLPAAVFLMRDVGLVDNFKQSVAVAFLCILPLICEAIASRVCHECSSRNSYRRSAGRKSWIAPVIVVAMASRAMAVETQAEEHPAHSIWLRLFELMLLLVASAILAPFNASRLHELKDAEHAIITLEWLRAYVGRLLGPIFAVLIFHWFGYECLLKLICTLSVVPIGLSMMLTSRDD
eukprot:TRINITY_DN28355_c0_g1_i1.p1 TRINITY_DN28355_c0_g1~~TRINITY_DN28355_c0_g1_i1.p1  ORF type:complete len:795 (+),score=94.85 TRINITY_DN28355_c0_g1_i1:40-2424(+)